MTKQDSNNKGLSTVQTPEIPLCGIIMPISGAEDCSAEHWSQVKEILSRSIIKANLTPKMVNESEEVAIIHRNIVHNIYHNPIVVCDVSHRNPNVMLELGMRLAFGKHVVIVKDDRTSMPFDAGVIEFIQYPRDLRHPEIERFILTLSEKILKTYEASQRGDKSTFLEYFREVKAPSLEGSEIPLTEYLEREFQALNAKVNQLGQKYESSNIKQSHRTTITAQAFKDDVLTRYFVYCRRNNIEPTDDESLNRFEKETKPPDSARAIIAEQFGLCPF